MYQSIVEKFATYICLFSLYFEWKPIYIQMCRGTDFK